MGLEIPTNKTPGDVIRSTEAERPAFIGLLIVGLTALELIFMVLLIAGVAQGANSATHVDPAISEAPFGTVLKSEQQILSFWLAGAFYCLAFIIFLYQRYFMDHVTIAKRRFRKWEDEGVQLHG